MLIGDLLRSYSLGIKTLYYQNTYDGKGDEEVEVSFASAEAMISTAAMTELTSDELLELAEEDCDSCSI